MGSFDFKNKIKKRLVPVSELSSMSNLIKYDLCRDYNIIVSTASLVIAHRKIIDFIIAFT